MTKAPNFPIAKRTRGIPLCRPANVGVLGKKNGLTTYPLFLARNFGYWVTLYGAFLFFLPKLSWSQHHPLILQKDGLPKAIEMDSSILWAVDSSGNTTPANVQTLLFQPFTGSFFLNKDHDYWLRLPVRNAASDSLNAVLCIDQFTKADLFFEKKPGQWEHRKAGLWTNFSERSYPPNRQCHPVLLAAGQEQTYYLQLSDYFHEGLRSSNIRLMTLSQEKEQRLEEASAQNGHQLFKGIFLGILLFFGLYSLLQYRLYQDKAYLFYSCYIVSLILFYLRNLDLQNPLPFLGDLKAYHPNLEALLGYLCYIFYLAFLRNFLDFRHRLPIHDQFLRWGTNIFIGLLVLDLLAIQPIFGWRTSLEVQSITKLPFFILSLWVVVSAAIKFKNRLASYILTGTALLLLPAIFTVYVDLTPGTYHEILSNTARSFKPEGHSTTFYMYDMRVGLLLEMFCFLIALTWKIKQENERIRALASYQSSGNGQAETTLEASTILSDEKTLLEAVKSIINDNLADEDFNVEKLARKMAMSRTRLFRNLQAEGVNASEIIQSMRLQRVKSLLEESTMTLPQIAAEVGYKSAGQLSRAYKRVFGVSPRKRQGDL